MDEALLPCRRTSPAPGSGRSPHRAPSSARRGRGGCACGDDRLQSSRRCDGEHSCSMRVMLICSLCGGGSVRCWSRRRPTRNGPCISPGVQVAQERSVPPQLEQRLVHEADAGRGLVHQAAEVEVVDHGADHSEEAVEDTAFSCVTLVRRSGRWVEARPTRPDDGLGARQRCWVDGDGRRSASAASLRSTVSPNRSSRCYFFMGFLSPWPAPGRDVVVEVEDVFSVVGDALTSTRAS